MDGESSVTSALSFLCSSPPFGCIVFPAELVVSPRPRSSGFLSSVLWKKLSKRSENRSGRRVHSPAELSPQLRTYLGLPFCNRG